MMRRARLVSYPLALALAIALMTATPADASVRRRHHRHYSSTSSISAGFEASDRVLQCIRGPWGSSSMESGGNYRAISGPYRGAYQMDDSFWRSYGANMIPEARQYLGHHQDAPPALQDAVARNGIRARGLQPWPHPYLVCPRS